MWVLSSTFVWVLLCGAGFVAVAVLALRQALAVMARRLPSVKELNLYIRVMLS
jgi:hypothetical protein